MLHKLISKKHTWFSWYGNALQWFRQEDYQLKASLAYIVRPCLTNITIFGHTLLGSIYLTMSRIQFSGGDSSRGSQPLEYGCPPGLVCLTGLTTHCQLKDKAHKYLLCLKHRQINKTLYQLNYLDRYLAQNIL